jgi:hypothetical protein
MRETRPIGGRITEQSDPRNSNNYTRRKSYEAGVQRHKRRHQSSGLSIVLSLRTRRHLALRNRKLPLNSRWMKRRFASIFAKNWTVESQDRHGGWWRDCGGRLESEVVGGRAILIGVDRDNEMLVHVRATIAIQRFGTAIARPCTHPAPARVLPKPLPAEITHVAQLPGGNNPCRPITRRSKLFRTSPEIPIPIKFFTMARRHPLQECQSLQFG